MTGAYSGDNHDDPWALESTSLIDKTLEELLKVGESEEEKLEVTTRLTVKTIQPGFITAFHILRYKYKLSQSAVQRICGRHGLALLRADFRFKELEQAIKHWSSQLSVTGSVFDLDSIENRIQLSPSNARVNNLKLCLTTSTHGAISDLSYDLGLYMSSVAFFCFLLSLSTTPILGSYAPMVMADSQRLWDYIENRTKWAETNLIKLSHV